MGKGQLYVIGSADDVYPRTNNHKPIAPRTSTVIENIRNPGRSVGENKKKCLLVISSGNRHSNDHLTTVHRGMTEEELLTMKLRGEEEIR